MISLNFQNAESAPTKLKMFKATKIFLISLLILILAVAVLRHALCRLIITSLTSKGTGLKLSIEQLNLDILSSNLSMQGIKLANPEGFQDGFLGEAKEISIQYDLLRALGGRLHFHQVKADISEIKIIRNESGDSNVAAFKKKRRQTNRAKKNTPSLAVPAEESQKQQKSRSAKFLIDRLEFRLRKVVFLNYKGGGDHPTMVVFTSEAPLIMSNVSDLGYIIESVKDKGEYGGLLDKVLGLVSQNSLKYTTNNIKQKVKDILPTSLK